jgi:hypothetical protein
MSTVFLSYSRADGAKAESIYAALSRYYEVFMDKSSISGGAAWAAQLEEAINTCSVVVVLCSVRALEPGRWVMREILFSLEQNKPIIPVRLDGNLPLALIDRQFIDGQAHIEEYVPELISAVAKYTSSVPADVEVDMLLAASIRAQLAGERGNAMAHYQRAASLDPSLPASAADLWIRLTAPPTNVVDVNNIVFIVSAEKLSESRYPDGRDTYRWSLRINAPTPVMEAISYVTYDLSSYFSDGSQTVRSRNDGFMVSKIAWGPLAFPIQIVFRDGNVFNTWIDLTLRNRRVPAPTEPFPLEGI